MQVINFYNLLKNTFLTEINSNKDIEYGSVLHGLLMSIQQQLNELEITLNTVAGNNGLFTQYGQRLDEIGLIVGQPRELKVIDTEDVIHDQILLKTIDGESLTSKILLTYNSLDDFINTDVYVIDGVGNQFKLIMPAENPEIVFQSSSALLSAIPTTIVNKFVAKDTQFRVTQFGNQLSKNILLYAAKDINLNKTYEADDVYRQRIQNLIGSKYAFTPSGLRNLIFNASPQVRDVYVKDKARGVGTVDVYVFPSIANVYDENGSFIIGSTLIENIKAEVMDSLPVGIDISILEAEKLVIKQDVHINYLTLNRSFSVQDQQAEIENQMRYIILSTQPGGELRKQDVLYQLIQYLMNSQNNKASQLYKTTSTVKNLDIYYEQSDGHLISYIEITDSIQLEPQQYQALGNVNVMLNTMQ